MADVVKQLSAEEARRLTDEFKLERKGLPAIRETPTLKDCEETLAHCALAEDYVYRVRGRALRYIRDGRLYRETCSTFEEYCQERWDWTRQRVNQLIMAADIADGLETTVSKPESERAARELAPLRDEPEAMDEAWEEVVESFGPAPTAEQVRSVVEQKVETPSSAAVNGNGHASGNGKSPKGWVHQLRSFSKSLPFILRHRKPPSERIMEALRIVDEMREALEAQLGRPAITGPQDGGMTQEEWEGVGSPPTQQELRL